MIAEQTSNAPQGKPILLSPWAVVLGALLVYGVTLNHWVTLRSLGMVSQITGWDWHPLPLSWRPAAVAPLFWILTCPIRLLPVSWQPLCLNIFTAICAALTLGLLALSVRLMPQDRTREQRLREGGEFGLLSIRTAFLPPLFAVFMLGLQLTFWQHAISATGEMLDLLVFAVLIFCVLRFRISQDDRWLLTLAFVFGLGLTENWALIGFFPLFLIALVWVKGFSFFNVRFLVLMTICGLAGLSLYLLAPAMGSLGADHARFWPLLHQELGAQTYALRRIPRYIVLVAALATLLPLLFAAVRWPSFAGELSATGNKLTQFMIQMLHVVFLVLPLVTFFSFEYSPSVRMSEMPNSFLTFYYVGALCIGYFSGYFLLVFSRKPAQAWVRGGPASKVLNSAGVALVWILAVAAPIGLACQNLPHIQAANSSALAQFSDSIVDELPAKNAIVLSDNSARLELLEATYQRRHLPNQNLLVDTTALPHREYIRYLTARYPEFKRVMTSPDKLKPVLPSRSLEVFMFQIGRSHQIYYLHPSFGYYFEGFYLRPQGLVYELKSYPNDAPQAPLPTESEIKANQGFWAKLQNGRLKALPALAKLDIDPEVVSMDYSVALNYWGTELQKANRLQDAHTHFAEAISVNTNNYFAQINLEYNTALLKGDRKPIESSELFSKALLRYHGLVSALKLNGPVDEPGIDLEVGEIMAEGGNLRQAAAFFTRRLQFLPHDPAAELAMAKTYADLGKVQKTADIVTELRASPKIKPWELERVMAMAYLAATNYSEAEKVLQNAIKENPTDEIRFGTLADLYRRAGYDAMHQNQPARGKAYFIAALTNIDLEVKFTSISHHSGGEDMRLAPAFLNKAELEMMLGSNAEAVATLNQVLQMQPDNATALLNRALAEVKINQIQAAKEDFKALADLVPQQSYVVDYRMAEIAALEKNIPDEIRYLKRYLRAAPEETPEYVAVKKRLQILENH